MFTTAIASIAACIYPAFIPSEALISTMKYPLNLHMRVDFRPEDAILRAFWQALSEVRRI